MKALTLVLCILALLGSAASGFFWWQIGETKTLLQKELSAEQTRAAGLENDLSQTKASLEQTNAKLAETDAALGDTKRSLTAAEARNVQTTRELEAAKRTIAAKEEAERKLNADLDQLRRELVQTRLAAQVGSPEELEKARQTIASLESRIAELQGNAAGASTTAADGSAAPAKPALSERTAAAKVAQVGSKNAFVVLELGTEDGISVGNKFAIKRAGDVIAESVISEVKETFAIAQVVPSSIKTTLKAGDIASYQD
jgi:Chromosome segregation ATPases